MRVDALAVRFRPRSVLEAADLGVRLVQTSAPSVYRTFAAVALPTMAIALGLAQVRWWLPGLVLWWAKPWLDRAILFALSRAAFGQATTGADLWRERRAVLFQQLVRTWTLQRVSPWRILTQPIYQLEGATARRAHDRVRQVRRRGHAGGAAAVMSVFWMCESCLTVALLSLIFWLAPADLAPTLEDVTSGVASPAVGIVIQAAYAVVVFFVEPLVVGAGFGQYLNRRAELEAWDIEQEFRRAFAS